MLDRIKVIGARGRVGSAVSARLAERGASVVEGNAELVLLCVPDRAISDVAAQVEIGPWVAHVSGATPLTVADVPGAIVAGVTIDAGTVESPVLLQVGKKNGNSSPWKNDSANPTTLSDVYFRVGGPHVGSVDVALEVNSNNVLIDHTWVWRADHGVEGFSGDT